jgi:hypothetical protein
MVLNEDKPGWLAITRRASKTEPGRTHPGLPGQRSERPVIETDVHFARGIRTEGGIDFLYLATVVQKRVNVRLQLCTNPCTAGNGMVVVTVAGPASGLLQIAFVEFTHDLFSINENRWSSAAPPQGASLRVDERPPAASSWRLYNLLSVTTPFIGNAFFVIFCNYY